MQAPILLTASSVPSPLAMGDLKHPPYSPDMSPYVDDAFTKTNNHCEEIIGAVGRSLLDMKRSGRAGSV
jgi:hypothetical protein